MATAPEHSGYTEYNNHKTDLALNMCFAQATKLLAGKQGNMFFYMMGDAGNQFWVLGFGC